jgi:hypothetical protein
MSSHRALGGHASDGGDTSPALPDVEEEKTSAKHKPFRVAEWGSDLQKIGEDD